MKRPKNIKYFLPSPHIFVALIIFLIVLQSIGCNYPDNFKFDPQNIFLWNYLEELGVVSIKEVFQPHGLITSLSANNLYFKIIFALIPSIYFLIVYHVLYKLYDRSKIITWILLSFYFLIVLQYSLLASFVRYGMLLFPGLFTAYIVSEKYKKTNLLLTGVLTGITTFLEMGVSLNLIAFNLFIFLFNYFYLYKTNSKRSLKLQLRGFGYYLIGLIIGSIPFLIFFIRNNLTEEFIYFFKDIVSFSSYAKIPTNYSHRMISLLLFIFTLNIAYIVRSIKTSFKEFGKLYYYLLYSTFVSTFLISTKFLVRDVLGILVFYIALNLVILLFPVYQYLKEKYKKIAKAVFSISTVSILCLLQFSNVAESRILGDFKLTRFKDYKWKNADKLLCNINNLDVKYLQLDTDYYDVYEYLKINHANENVYFYPIDLVFYPYLGIKPPPYPTTWEASPLYAQDKNIDFIRNNEIGLVVYNFNYPTNDGVPEYVRAKTLHKYLMTNFHPIYKNSEFVVMKKNDNANYYFMHDQNLVNKYEGLFKANLDVSFGEVFYLEGKYKTERLLENSEIVMETTDLEDIKSSINENHDDLDNLILLIKYKDEDRVNTTIIVVDNGVESTVFHKMCGMYNCLIKLSNILVLYKNVNLDSIELENKPTRLTLLKAKDVSYLW